MHRVRSGWIICLSLLLAACSRGPESVLHDYAERVARVVEQPLAEPASVALPTLALRELELPLAKADVGLLEFLRLNVCELGMAVGKKNSTLGKVAPPSQRMHMERDFLLLAPDCVAQLQDSRPELSNKLQQALQLKQSQRLQQWWNAWLTAKEWQQFISSAAAPLEMTGDEPAHLSRSLQALDYAIAQGQRWQQQDYVYNSSDMEFHQQQLLLGETLGKWLHAQALQTDVLNRVAQVLEQRYAEKPLCMTGQQTDKAKILFTVFQKFYLAQVQPYMSRSDQLGQQLLADLTALQSTLQQQNITVPKAYQQWLAQLQQRQQGFTRASQRHVYAWRTTLTECGFIPGQ
ncbi:DUF3080 family protein [Bacterioplanes sanyensis]|uniref:DUF3080 family protein n=1 Tax=Bacterioplanes sanyensis TaxID=1249553 RepID=UPI0012FDAF7C|nr:DUF3080 family protein [Bacterioplanes sanyensis]